MKLKGTSIKLDEQLHEEVKREAKEGGLNVSSFVRVAVIAEIRRRRIAKRRSAA